MYGFQLERSVVRFAIIAKLLHTLTYMWYRSAQCIVDTNCCTVFRQNVIIANQSFGENGQKVAPSCDSESEKFDF